MSKETFAEQFAQHEGLARAQIWADMWGIPQPNTKYPVKLMFALEDDELNTTILKSDTCDDCGNPFFYEDLGEWMFGLAHQRNEIEAGYIYIWEGYYLKYKNGNYRFTGKLKKAVDLKKVWEEA